MTEVYDYVIVGGGMTGCGIVAELLDFRPDASILIIDKQERLGGWRQHNVGQTAAQDQE